MDAHVSFDPREDAYSKPLDQIDVSVPELYQNDVYQPYFERLRARIRCTTPPTATSVRTGR